VIENNAGLGDLDHPKMVRYLIKLMVWTLSTPLTDSNESI